MNISKKIPNNEIVTFAKRLPRNEDGILKVSSQLIARIKEDKDIYDFNLNYLPVGNRVIRFKSNAMKEEFLANEFIYDSDIDAYVSVGERNLADLLKTEELKNILYLPGLEVLLTDVKIESCVLMAGSFNPLHHGHTQLLNDACKTTGQSCMGVYELSISNAAKSEINDIEIYRRTHQFIDEKLPLLITNKPYFRGKVNFIDTNSWFCIGADTYRRFFDVQYYEGPEQLQEFTVFLEQNGVQLLVGPRLNTDKVDHVQDYLALVPDGYKLSVKEVENFRVDISSTEIRKARKLIA